MADGHDEHLTQPATPAAEGPEEQPDTKPIEATAAANTPPADLSAEAEEFRAQAGQ